MAKLNHPPFEEWLAARAELTADEAGALHVHLLECDACAQLDAALKTVDGMLRAAPALVPAPGFAARWQARLAVQRARSQRRQTWLILAVAGGGALLLLALLLVLLLPVFQSPLPFIVSGVYQLTKVYTTASVVGGFLSSICTAIFALLPPTMWAAILLVISSLAVIWTAAIWRITSKRRVIS